MWACSAPLPFPPQSEFPQPCHHSYKKLRRLRRGLRRTFRRHTPATSHPDWTPRPAFGPSRFECLEEARAEGTTRPCSQDDCRSIHAPRRIIPSPRLCLRSIPLVPLRSSVASEVYPRNLGDAHVPAISRERLQQAPPVTSLPIDPQQHKYHRYVAFSSCPRRRQKATYREPHF